MNLPSPSPWSANQRLQARKSGENQESNLLPKLWDEKQGYYSESLLV